MNKNLLGVSVVVALTVLIIYFVNLNAIQRPAEQAKNDHWAEQARTAPENFQLVCPAPAENENSIATDQCKRQGQYEYDRQQQIIDHKAQVSMRNAAWFGFGLGVVGMFLLAWTLHETQGAARSAADTLKIAQDTLVEAKKSTRLEMQPYLSCSQILIRENTRVKGKEVRTHQIIKIKNNGKTPAYITGSATSIIASLKTVDPWSKSKDVQGRFHQSWYIPPNGEESIPMYTKYEFERFDGGKVDASQINIKGRFTVFYTDEFTADGKEMSAAFDYGTGDNLDFKDGFASMLVGSTYSTTETDKPKRQGH